jgi:hypothetical protein
MGKGLITSTLLTSLTMSHIVPIVSLNPSGVSNKDTKYFSKFVTEAEIKHGRVAMVSSVIIPTLELFNGDKPGINELNSQSPAFQLTLLGIFACSEVSQLLKAFEFPMTTVSWFKMKEDHSAGDYSFDPLNLKTKIEFNDTKAQSIEITNGRLAMLATFGMLVQELCTDQTVIDTLKF